MSERDPDLAPLQALIGTWTTEATHPQFDGVVAGSTTFEWAAGGRFLVQRSHNHHESFPDAISVIGAHETGEGLVAEYFDSRGVRRTYGVSLEDGVLRLWRDDPTFAQRFSAEVRRDSFAGLWQLARTPGDWRDDLRMAFRRRAVTGALFAGIRVRDLTTARAWYQRLLGEPSSFPNATEAVWTLADGRSIYIQEEPDRAGGGLATVFADELDAAVEQIRSRGLEPAESETYSNGVRKATYRDPDGNEIGFGGGPA